MTTSDKSNVPDALLTQALTDASKSDDDGRSLLGEFAATAHAVQWLQVMAVPRLFGSLKRTPQRSHLLLIIDIFIAYVRSGKQFTRAQFEEVPYEQRESLALRLRKSLESWPNSDYGEIANIVRELLYADGTIDPPGGWDNIPDPDIPPDAYLLQPEDAGNFALYAERFSIAE